MNRDTEVLDIYNRDIPIKEKIHLLEELALDLYNELEAQAENMHPELHNKLSEGYMMAKNLIRKLQDEQK